ncbi:MAG: hypothetical protein HY343_13100 [Lentisphaerae bacterium]|nr:hypothetical protein [Lentisphaerota bacterium]
MLSVRHSEVWIFRAILALAPLFPFPLTAADSAVTEIRLTPVHGKTDDRSGHIRHSITLNASLPAGEWKLPDLQDRKPLFGFITLGSARHLILVDRVPETNTVFADVLSGFTDAGEATASFFTRLYVDVNGNGSLLDDPPIPTSSRQQEGIPAAFFSPISVPLPLGGADIPYRLALTIAARTPADAKLPTEELLKRISTKLVSLTRLEGSATLDGKACRLTLSDSDLNGDFGDTRRDMLSLAMNSAGFSVLFPDILGIGPATYSVEWKPDRGVLLLTPLAPPSVSTLALPAGSEQLQLDGSAPAFRVALIQPAAKLLLPPSTYTLAGYTILRDSTNGNAWILQANAPPAHDSGGTVLPAGGEASLPFGPPLQSTPIVRGTGQNLRFGVRTTGCGGETVSRVALLPRSRRKLSADLQYAASVAPFFRIVDKDDQTVARGKFEFGCGGSCSAAWSRGVTMTNGPYSVICGYTNAPFETREGRTVLP